MDKGRHGGRAFHRVRQPHKQRNLRRLARRAHKQEQRRHRQQPGTGHRRRLDRPGVHHDRELLEVQRAELGEENQHAEDEAEVADAVDDKRLLAGVSRGRFGEVETNQQIRTEAHALPADEHHREAGAQHQDEHERGEQVQVREITRKVGVRLVVHVGRGIQVNQGADARDHQNHQRRERVEAQRKRNLQMARRDPREHVFVDGAHATNGFEAQHRPHRHGRDAEGAGHRRRRDAAGDVLGPAATNGRVDQEPEKRKERYQQQAHRFTTSTS